MPHTLPLVWRCWRLHTTWSCAIMANIDSLRAHVHARPAPLVRTCSKGRTTGKLVRITAHCVKWQIVFCSKLWKTAGKWQKCNLVSGHGLCGQRHGLAMNWVDRPRTSAVEQDVVWAPSCRDCVWSVAGFGRFFIDLLFLREQSPWSFSGLDSCVLAYCGSDAPQLSPHNLCTTTQVAIVKLRGDSSDLCTLFIWSV